MAVTAPIPTPTPQTPAPRRRRRRGWIALIAILIIVAAAAVAAEFIARAVVRDQVRQNVVQALGMPADHPVDVGLEGIVLAQLAGGALDVVSLSSDDVPIGDMTADADVELTRVPVRDGVDGGPGTGRLWIDAATVEQLFAQSRQPGVLASAALSLDEPDIVLSNEFPVLGAQVPVSLALTPGAAEGGLTFTPTKARLGDVELGLDQLAAVIGMPPEPATVCIADRLPAGLSLADVSVVGDQLVAEVTLAEGMLTDPALQQPGTCG
ncbi:LmeA family phospholipid-binding protein [Microbacterium rhizophilus]|uniref:LmeA family phospholipid-binding protein n=1 Tax=Microbacterium rhizophilus TaxID=3138934 RepID=UPI0031EC4E8A